MTTIVCIGDARQTSSEHGSNGWTKLTPDLNQVKTQSPTNSCDGIFLIGDFDKVKDAQKSFAASTVNNIPHFYVIGNHEITDDDPNYTKGLYPYSSYGIPLKPGPTGTDKTTYSMDIGDIHIINVNIYWDGGSGEFKSDGYISDALYNWISTDLSNTTKKWKVVLLHEPLYPCKRHVGDSLDANKSNRDKFQALLVSKGVHVVYAAHTHYSHVTKVNTSTGKECSELSTSGPYHIDCGVSGPKINDGEDGFCSLFYTETRGNDLIITWKKGPWSSPKTTTYTIPGGVSGSKPILTSMSPLNTVVGDQVHRVVIGTNFNDTSDVIFHNIDDLYADGHSSNHNPIITSTTITLDSLQGNYPGTYEVYVKNGDGQVSNTITSIVTEETNSGLSSITLIGCAAQPKQIGDQCTMTPICKNTSGEIVTCPILNWESNDNSVVSVTESNGKGKATALNDGSCNVTAEFGGTTSNSVPFTVIESKSDGNIGLILVLATAASYYFYKSKNKTQ